MRLQGIIAALAAIFWAGAALGGEPGKSAPELTVGPNFLDLATEPQGRDGGQPLFDLNLGRETLWLDFDQRPLGRLRDGGALVPPDAIVDFYPFDGGLRFTGGMIYDSPVMGADAPSGALPFTPSSGLSPSAIDWGQYTPYAGVGLQSSFLRGRLEFAIDLGLSYQGSPEVDPTGPSEPRSEAAVAGSSGESHQDDAQPLNVLGFSPRAGLTLKFRF